MIASLTLNGRLPGVVVETAVPVREQNPLRLDVAAFVGFAERGPLDTPVAVEDIAQYQQIFGGDLLIARDGGRPVFAHLPRAVQSFFENGGRRCYVVRVAGEGARANTFALPGLVRMDADGARSSWQRAMAASAWVGAWSDVMRVETQLRLLPLRIGSAAPAYQRPTGGAPRRLALQVPSPDVLRRGDVLRVWFKGSVAGQDAWTQLVFRVAQVTPTGSAQGTLSVVPVEVTGLPGEAVALRDRHPDLETHLDTVSNYIVRRLEPSGWRAWPTRGAAFTRTISGGRTTYHVYLPVHAARTVASGDMLELRLSGSSRPIYMVDRVEPMSVLAGDPPLPGEPTLAAGEYLRLSSERLYWLINPDTLSDTPEQVERLRFDLYIHEGSDPLVEQRGQADERTPEIWRDLRFGADDAYDIQQIDPPARIGSFALTVPTDYWPDRLTALGDGLLRAEVAQFAGRSLRLRAPDDHAASLWLPVDMLGLPASASAQPDPLASGKDGLDTFAPESLFIDPRFALATVSGVVTEAEYLLYQQTVEPIPTHLHSLYAIDEVALVALPDVIHRPWGAPVAIDIPQEPPKPQEPPDRSQFRPCAPPPDEPRRANLPEEAPCYPLDESPALPPPADDGLLSRLARMPIMIPASAYGESDIEALVSVQRAAITLCAGRADLLAVLDLPLHFRKREAVEWRQRIDSIPSLMGSSALSYAAAYHGWVRTPEQTVPTLAPDRLVPPAGVVCGMIAARELARGVWVGPANEPLAGVLGLQPSIDDRDWADLYDRQINILRQQPGRFTLMSAFTLYQSDRSLFQISVRRLMILLRKLAWRRGMQYAFETNNERFRQYVQISFERALRSLMDRGALAAFEVVTGPELNTPNDAYNGRFLIALKVAPTQPIEFITVVMLRSGDNLFEFLEF